jgi:uncharacterized protein
MKKFDSATIKQLKRYVYLLSDPDSGEIFYVGKGVKNRVFDHLKDNNTENDKVKKIKEIKERGKIPKIEILVHGIIDELTINKIESAMIDLIGKDNLTNIVRGYESAAFGRMDVTQVIAKYARKKANISEPVLLLKLSETFRYNMTPMELYDYTRGIWKLRENRIKNVSYAFPVYDGIIQETYEVIKWFPAHTTFNSRLNRKNWDGKRWEFVGQISNKMRKKYRYKSVSHYWKDKATQSKRYLNC